MKKVVSLSLDEELLARVDEERGDVSRSRYVERAVERRLDDPVGPGWESALEDVRRQREADEASRENILAAAQTPPKPPSQPEPPADHRWRCKHRSCSYTAPTAGQCDVHLGSLVRADRPDLLIS